MTHTDSEVTSGSRRSGDTEPDGPDDPERAGTWSFAQARRAASRLRATPLAHQVLPVVRPRSVLGLFRSRAPLPLQLFVAARDGLLAELGDGFAVLRRPALSPPVTTGGRLLRLARLLDRRWDLLLFGGPALAGVTAAAACTPAAPAGAITAALLTVGWMVLLLAAMTARHLISVARTAGGTAAGPDRAGGQAAGSHWSVPLFHQPDPGRVEELARQVTERLARLAQAAPAPVILADGVSTPEARSVLARTLLARTVLAEPARAAGGHRAARAMPRASRWRPAQAVARLPARGGLLLTGMAGLAVTLAACTAFLATHEAPVCTAASCTGAPGGGPVAFRSLLLLADPAGLGPGSLAMAVLGWLLSAACAALVAAVYVAGRQETARGRLAGQDCPHHGSAISGAARVLIMVVTDAERDAMFAAVRRHAGVRAEPDTSGERIIYALGLVAGTEVLLAQAGEQGTMSSAGMLVTARAAIRQCCPDYVILAGICYGLRRDQGQRLGDVVVARRIHHIDPRKVTDQPGPPVIGRGINVGCSPVLLNRFQASQLTWPAARVHLGTVLCSSMLVDSRAVVTGLRRDYPDAIAGEMEAVAVYEAAAEAPKPDWIMVKAIADWGYAKSDLGQDLAARNAADLVTHVIASAGLRQWQRRQSLPCDVMAARPGR